jgi:spore coat protein U-like protein
MVLICAALLVTAGLCGDAAAATDSGQFKVSATSGGGCTFGTVSDLNFGAYNPLSATDTTGSTSMSFYCTKGQTFNWYITGDREMINGEEKLAFELYSDSSRTQVFPAEKTDGFGGIGADVNALIVQDIYGTIAKGQNVTGGLDFTATMTAVVDY